MSRGPRSVTGEFWHAMRLCLGATFYPRHCNHAGDYLMLVQCERSSIAPGAVPPDNPALRHCDKLLGELKEKYARTPYALELQEVWEAEVALLQALPAEALEAKLNDNREAYRAVDDDAKCRAPSAAASVSRAQLRALLTAELRRKHWFQLNAILLERGFRSLKRLLVNHFNACVALICLITLWEKMAPAQYKVPVLAVLIWVFSLGMLGAVISVARRTSNFDKISASDIDPVVRVMRMQNGNTGVHLSVISGGAFALVLHFFFVSDIASPLIQSMLMPRFQSPGCAVHDLCMSGLLPRSGTEWAKLMTWSFIAGFAEKLVPDILDRFSQAPRGRRGRTAEPPPG